MSRHVAQIVTTSRLAAALALGGTVVPAMLSAQNTATGATVYTAFFNGDASPDDHLWNTTPLPELPWNVFFNTSADGSGSWLNPDVTLSQPLTAGTHTWYLFGEGSGTSELYMGINLYLNSMATPTLSAYNLRGSAAPPMTNEGRSTIFGAVGGPLSVTLNGQTVRITDFTYGAPAGDLVGQQSIGRSGTSDYTGMLTLSVSGGMSRVPEPGTVLLLGSGLLGVGLVARRRKPGR
jgi:hypothetical protein